MKLMASGVAIWAGMTRSPSFSRSSSSARMTIRPLRNSSTVSSTDMSLQDDAARDISTLQCSE